MEKLLLNASGGLNQDVSESIIPNGDYIDAKNIIVDAGREGDAGLIKKIEGVVDAQDSFTESTFNTGVLTELDDSSYGTYYTPHKLLLKITDNVIAVFWGDIVAGEHTYEVQLADIDDSTGVITLLGSSFSFGLADTSGNEGSVRSVLLDSTHIGVSYVSDYQEVSFTILEINTSTGAISLPEPTPLVVSTPSSIGKMSMNKIDDGRIVVVADLKVNMIQYDTGADTYSLLGAGFTITEPILAIATLSGDTSTSVSIEPVKVVTINSSISLIIYNSSSSSLSLLIRTNVSTGVISEASDYIKIGYLINDAILADTNKVIISGRGNVQTLNINTNEGIVSLLGSATVVDSTLYYGNSLSLIGTNEIIMSGIKPDSGFFGSGTIKAYSYRYEDNGSFTLNGSVNSVGVLSDSSDLNNTQPLLIGTDKAVVSWSDSPNDDFKIKSFTIERNSVSAIAGDIKAATSSNNGNTYALYKDGTTARVVEISSGVVRELLNYEHVVTTDFDPDIRIIGDSLVWNYLGDGVPLTWYIPRSVNGSVKIVNINNIYLIKPQPSAPDIRPTYTNIFSTKRYEYNHVWTLVSGSFNHNEDGGLEMDGRIATFVEINGDVTLTVSAGDIPTPSVLPNSESLTVKLYSVFGFDEYSVVFSNTDDGTVDSLSISAPTNGLYRLEVTATNDAVVNYISISGSGINESQSDVFRNNSFQFAARYIYDSSEVSALSSYSNTLVANNYISSCYISVGGETPTYATGIELYSRKNGTGPWFRVKTIDLENDQISYNGGIYYVFKGEMSEALADRDAARTFDAIPIDTKSLEVIDNRIFLANNQDDLDNSGLNSVSISSSAFGATVSDNRGVSYLNSSIIVLNSSIDPFGGIDGKESLPFANNSSYEIGYIFLDEFGRTRGVERSTIFETGMFEYPFLRLTLSPIGSFPSWATDLEVVMSKNLTKDYSYEGYASFIYWIGENPEGDITLYDDLVDIDRSTVRYFAVNISGMIESGIPYVFNEGDLINIHLAETTTYDKKNVKTLRVLGQIGADVLCEWNEGLSTTLEFIGSTQWENRGMFFFEIFSPSPQESDVVMYSTGYKIDLSTFTTNEVIEPVVLSELLTSYDLDPFERTTSNTIDGDMSFRWVEISGFSTSPIVSGAWDESVGVYNRPFPSLVRQPNQSRNRSTWDRSLGKPYLKYENTESIRQESKIRFGGRYIQGTKINSISSFFVLDQNEVPYENGPITSIVRTSKLQQEGSILLAISERETASVYINEVVVRDGGSGDAFTAASDKVIGTVRTLKGSFGATSKLSIAAYEGSVYFWDSNKKKVIRYNRNGLTPISDVGMNKFFFDQSGTPSGYINPIYRMYTIDFGNNLAVGYSEKSDRWVSFYNGGVEIGVHSGDDNIYFKDQDVWKNSTTNYDQYVNAADSSFYIQFVANTGFPVLLSSIYILNNKADYIDYTESNYIQSGILQIDIENEKSQTTQLKDVNFIMEDNLLYAHILRDTSGGGTLNTGPHMIGALNKVKFTVNDLNDNVNNYGINGIALGYTPTAGHNL